MDTYNSRRSCQPPAFSQSRPLSAMSTTDQHLELLITNTIRRALAAGALQPIATEQLVIEEHGIPFVVRWVSELARKRMQAVNASGRRPDYNPFLPYDTTLEVDQLGQHHVALLNKYPVMDRHLLIVTRAYEEQTDPLTSADLAALWSLIERLGGMGFCNGGQLAGASQHHKHLQWIPADPEDPSSIPIAAAVRSAQPQRTPEAVPAFPFRHAFRRLDDIAAQPRDKAGDTLQACFTTLCEGLGMQARTGPLPPYNLLLTRSWMLLVPRTRESWQRMSINSLGFAGLLFVPEKSQIDAVRQAGPLSILSSVTGLEESQAGVLRPLAEKQVVQAAADRYGHATRHTSDSASRPRKTPGTPDTA